MHPNRSVRASGFFGSYREMIDFKKPSLPQFGTVQGRAPVRTVLRRSLQVSLFLTALGMGYISLSDSGTRTAQAASPDTLAAPETLKLRPPAESSRQNELLASTVNAGQALDPEELGSAPRVTGATTYPLPELEPVRLSILKDNSRIQLRNFPAFSTSFGGRYAATSEQGDMVYYTLDPELQSYVSSMVKKAAVPHIAAVAMDPRTGKVLAIADKSRSIQNLSLHSGFPAASLFKVVTAAAAVERSNLSIDSRISYRGGTYTLEPWNFAPDPRRDRNSLALGDALGKSCNPVFGRVALMHLNPSLLENYSRLFGFNRDLQADLPLTMSSASIPRDDYGLSRTGAGFGEVRISPLHAAALMSGIANGGILPRPKLVEKVVSRGGKVVYQAQNDPLARIIETETSRELMRMMQHTTTTGTSRKEFIRQGKSIMRDVAVAGKTGTLRGNNPEGLNTWFIGAAPMENPRIAVAVIVVNPSYGNKASHFGREVLEKFLFGTVTESAPVVYRKAVTKSSKKSAAKSKAPAKKVTYAKKPAGKAKSPAVKSKAAPVKLKAPAKK